MKSTCEEMAQGGGRGWQLIRFEETGEQVQLLTARQPAAPACPPLLRRMKSSLMTKPCPDSHDLCLALVLASSGHLNQQSPHGSRLAGGATETTNSMDSWMQTHIETTPSWWKTQKTSILTSARYLLPHSRTARCLPPAAPPEGTRSPALRAGFPPQGRFPTALSAQPPQRSPLNPAGGLPQTCCDSGTRPSLNSLSYLFAQVLAMQAGTGRSHHSWRFFGRLTKTEGAASACHVAAGEGSEYLTRGSRWTQSESSSKEPAPSPSSSHPAGLLLQPGRHKAALAATRSSSGSAEEVSVLAGSRCSSVNWKRQWGAKRREAGCWGRHRRARATLQRFAAIPILHYRMPSKSSNSQTQISKTSFQSAPLSLFMKREQTEVKKRKKTEIGHA